MKGRNSTFEDFEFILLEYSAEVIKYPCYVPTLGCCGFNLDQESLACILETSLFLCMNHAILLGSWHQKTINLWFSSLCYLMVMQSYTWIISSVSFCLKRCFMPMKMCLWNLTFSRSPFYWLRWFTFSQTITIEEIKETTSKI